MYKHSYGFFIISSIIRKFENKINGININFLIPSYPSSSFRKTITIAFLLFMILVVTLPLLSFFQK